ncbi:hypothetical protein Y1Q_0004573 [Alligator mississippiensis]|uniref:Uncharacterized protein n=1 Tax=Alligator mississippiensis TaxID=8496 RepID=A0A151MHJ0_ALLMI|nr:hypothetical protein Y1Q_0004573 [Alligator mississippiensis]
MVPDHTQSQQGVSPAKEMFWFWPECPFGASAVPGPQRCPKHYSDQKCPGSVASQERVWVRQQELLCVEDSTKVRTQILARAVPHQDTMDCM